MTSRVAELHADWLKLVEPVDPFLTLPVLNRAFPDGLDRVSTEARVEVRSRLAALNGDVATQTTWIEWVVMDLLGHGGFAVSGPEVPERLTIAVPEHRSVLRPEWAVVGPTPESRDRIPRLLVNRYSPGTAFDAPVDGQTWAATPVERMVMLCRATGVELGLLTDGRIWHLLWARPNEPVGHGTWDASFFSEERAHLDSFSSILGAKRFYAVAPPDTIEALLDESSDRQEAVTRQLGDQVRAATELLVASISRANRERAGTLLAGVDPRTVYEAAVTVMMRLVFLLYAEERQLLPLNDDTYDRSYAVSTMLHALEEEADATGEEPLERRSTAWHRLLASFRAVHGGIQHEDLRIPAYGGRLFDPERFPFLEGRSSGDPWRDAMADPLPIEDLTVKAILRALQVLEFREAGVRDIRQLSFATLDVEQIGHVYEGLLDHSAVATDEIVLGLKGRRSKERTSEPETPLPDIEAAAARGRKALVAWIRENTGLTEQQTVKALDSDLDPDQTRRLLEACENDRTVFERVAPYSHLLRADLRGLPIVFLEGSVYVTEVSLRRDTGTQYTTKELSEEVARYTLEPLVYHPGPGEGAEPEDWRLKSSEEILRLRVCDPAVGSGAILVAACRYLADRVAEAWIVEGVAEERAGSAEMNDLLLTARRAVAGQCLYGVDRDAMAAEMAKLSLWLVTMAKERPFAFVDHAIQVGDSLLGVTDLDQIRHFHMEPAAGRVLHSTLFDYTAVLEPLIEQAVEKRLQLESIDVVTIRDAEERQRLFVESANLVDALRVVADLVVGATLSTVASSKRALNDRLLAAAQQAAQAFDTSSPASARAITLKQLAASASDWLDDGRPEFSPSRQCLHWPLAFPEVFMSTRAGFDACLGNPPFAGGLSLARRLGVPFERLLKRLVPESSGRVDLATYFHRRVDLITSGEGVFTLLGPDTLIRTANRRAGTEPIIASGRSIVAARRQIRWPGSAAVWVCMISYSCRRPWRGDRVLDGRVVAVIDAGLEPRDPRPEPARLKPWISYTQGVKLFGMSFARTRPDWEEMIAAEPDLETYLRPYVNGKSLCDEPNSSSDLLVADFGESDKESLRSVMQAVAEIEAAVSKERANQKRQIHEHRNWLFWDKRTSALAEARALERVFVAPNLSKHFPLLAVDPNPCFSAATTVIITADFAVYGILQSSFFLSWLRLTGAPRGSGIAFSTRDTLDTFVPPEMEHLQSVVRKPGSDLWYGRHRFMLRRAVGVTEALNALHDPSDGTSEAIELRSAQVALDQAAAAAYGWGEMDLAHDFVETSQGIRWTIGRAAQAEVLDRLLEANHDRHAQETGTSRGAESRRKTGSAPPRRTDGQLTIDVDERVD